MAKSILKIVTNEKGNKKTKQIKYTTRDPETVQVNYSIDGSTKTLLGEINFGTDLPTEPPDPDTPPKVEAGEDVTVKQGTTVQLDGSAKDDGTITSISWQAPDGIELMDISEDETNAKFIAPMLLDSESFKILQFILHVEDDKGNHSMDSCLVTVVKDVIIPPEPEQCPIGTHKDPSTGACIPDTEPPTSGDLLYTSNETGKWKGNNRTISGTGSYDPLFPKPFVNGKGLILAASGSNKKLVITDGEGDFSSGAGHPRYYIDSSNYSAEVTYETKFNDTNARNQTQQNQSRHNHGGDRENKFGGFNHELDIEGQKVGLKIEVEHGGEHISGGDKSLPKKLSAGQWIGVRNTDQHIGNRKVRSKTELNYGDGWVLAIEKTYDLSDSSYDFIFNKELYLQSSAHWFRMNPNTTSKGFVTRNIEVRQLPIA